MTITVNKLTLLTLLLSIGILFSSCKTSEEIVEPEPEPEQVEEEVEEEVFEEPEPEPEEVDYVEELSTVNYGFDMDNINDQAARILAQNVELLRENPATRVRVDAYTDHVGGSSSNSSSI
jgi:outer membrane protein OmpA-like peptidoglycan-associated protein